MRKNLKKLREDKGLTQTVLAAQLKIGTRQYQALEAGTSDGSVKVWQKLKEILNQPIDFLLEQEVDIGKKPDGNRAE